MPATPPPTAARARTPPTPLHGPRYDNYEPYSPRRSTRSTAQSNPYSSLNGERSPKSHPSCTTSPPTTVKKARFARNPTQLSSPPSSPASPVKRRFPQQLHKTPRKQPFNSRKAVNGAQSGSDGPSRSSLAAPTIDPVTTLPTPNKTPKDKKRQAAALSSTARVLNFQPNHPNDVMPSPRRMKKHSRQRQSMNGFELYEDEMGGKGAEIAIYTDANARVPQMDESEDNPFTGRKKSSPPRPPHSRRSKKSAEELDRDAQFEAAVRRDEGVTYVFRGKKIFRKFDDDEEDRPSSAGTDTSGTAEQRSLKRKAGAAAQRPLTRSAMKPRLLFPSEEQRLERERGQDDVDEEAVTDIEMPNAASPVKGGGTTGIASDDDEDLTTPINDRFKPPTPPPTTTSARARRSGRKKASVSPNLLTPNADEDTMATTGADESFSSAASYVGKRKTRSPFDTWQRTKSGRKRAGEAMEEGLSGGKRTRSAVLESPA